jgi:uncharacterized membrane protein
MTNTNLGEILFFGAIAAIVIIGVINSSIRRQMMEQRRMGGGMGFGGYGMHGGYGGGYYRSRPAGGLIVVMLMFFGAIVLMVQFKEGYNDQTTARDGRPSRAPTEVNTSNTGSIPDIYDTPDGYDVQTSKAESQLRNAFDAAPRNRQYLTLSGEDNTPVLYETTEEKSIEAVIAEAAAANEPEESITEFRLGFGKQLLVLSDQANTFETARNLQHELQDTHVFIAVTTENGTTRYKIIAGNYPDKSTAKAALPELNRQYPGSYAVDLKELMLVYSHGAQ